MEYEIDWRVIGITVEEDWVRQESRSHDQHDGWHGRATRRETHWADAYDEHVSGVRVMRRGFAYPC